MTKTFVFIYYHEKDNKVKALPLEQSELQNSVLLHSGWVHTATLDPCAWVEHLCNKSNVDGIINEIEELKKIK